MDYYEIAIGMVTVAIIGGLTIIAIGLCYYTYKDAKRNDKTYRF